MSENLSSEDQSKDATRYQGTSVLEIYQNWDETWEVTQKGLDVTGTGESVPRATEDFARRLAESKEELDDE